MSSKKQTPALFLAVFLLVATSALFIFDGFVTLLRVPTAAELLGNQESEDFAAAVQGLLPETASGGARTRTVMELLRSRDEQCRLTSAMLGDLLRTRHREAKWGIVKGGVLAIGAILIAVGERRNRRLKQIEQRTDDSVPESHA